MVDFPSFAMRDLVEHGVHYGHKTSYWNPLMSDFIYGVDSGGSHIIDLRSTSRLLDAALKVISDVASKGGKFLFLGTRPVVADVVRQQAVRCSQHYMVFRWLGGTFTNWKTVSASVKKMMAMKDVVESKDTDATKYEKLKIKRKVEKASVRLYGLKDMDSLPEMLIIFDVGRDKVAIREANTMKIPVIGIVDTNNSPMGVDYVIPANDDSSNSIYLISKLIADAIIFGSLKFAERPVTTKSQRTAREDKIRESKGNSEDQDKDNNNLKSTSENLIIGN